LRAVLGLCRRFKAGGACGRCSWVLCFTTRKDAFNFLKNRPAFSNSSCITLAREPSPRARAAPGPPSQLGAPAGGCPPGPHAGAPPCAFGPLGQPIKAWVRGQRWCLVSALLPPHPRAVLYRNMFGHPPPMQSAPPDSQPMTHSAALDTAAQVGLSLYPTDEFIVPESRRRRQEDGAGLQGRKHACLPRKLLYRRQ
jgi:hypothetical protein